MTKDGNKKFSIVEFILRVCSLERFVEVKRQMLCDKEDFQPYVAFMRINRDSGHAITPSMVHKFLSENLVDVSLRRCQLFVEHYDIDRDGVLSYKEFIEVLLPREHPELRAFVSQQECFTISRDEFLSYETECCLASLVEREVYIFEDAKEARSAMQVDCGLNPAKILELVDNVSCGNLNFNNLQKFLNSCGLLPYDAEIINFLRRLDKDDDGVVDLPELERFLKNFEPAINADMEDPYGSVPRNQTSSKLRDASRGVSEEKVRKHSPHRKVVDHQKSKALLERPSEGPRQSASHARTDRERAVRPVELPNPSETRLSTDTSQTRSRAHLSSKTSTVHTLHYSNRRANGLSREDKLDSDSSYKLKALEHSSQNSNSDQYRRMLEAQIGQSSAQSGRRHTPLSRQRYEADVPVDPDHSRDVRSHPKERVAGNRSERIQQAPHNEEERDKERLPAGVSDGASRSRSINKGGTKKVILHQVPSEDRMTQSSLHEQSIAGRSSNVFKQETPSNRNQLDLRRSLVGSSAQDRDKSQPPPANNVKPTNQHNSHDTREFGKQSSQYSSVESKSSEAIYKAFKMILNQERNLELARRELVTKNDFDVAEIFARIDKKGRNWFTIEDFRVFLNEIGLKNIETRSLIDLYSSFDISQSCLLNFEQLVNMLCPMDNRFSVYLNKPERRELSESTTELLADVFNRQFSMRKSLVDAKRLIKNENLDLNIIFDVIDADQKGVISFHDVLYCYLDLQLPKQIRGHAARQGHRHHDRSLNHQP